MRTVVVWSTVFLSGFIAALILAPVFSIGRTEVVHPSNVTHVDEPEPPRPESEPVQTSSTPQSADLDLDTHYRGAALTTLRMLKSRMRDPDSAQFRNLWVVDISDDGLHVPAVCGEVNSRNAFGAYTGFTPFLAAQEFAIMPDDSVFQSMYSTNCAPHRRRLQMMY